MFFGETAIKEFELTSENATTIITVNEPFENFGQEMIEVTLFISFVFKWFHNSVINLYKGLG